MVIHFAKLAAVALAAFISFVCPEASAETWDHAHGDAANVGFVDVSTAPAARPSRTVTDLGTFATGAGPVIAPDGTVYLGTREGKLIALHADGSASWSRQLPRDQGIVASPVIGADGSVYVIGSMVVRDHRGGQTRYFATSMLHKFTPGGGWISHTAFPDGAIGVAGAPNLITVGGREFVLAPVLYRGAYGGTDLRIIGFEGGIGLALQATVMGYSSDITGGSGLEISCLCNYNPTPATTPLPPPPMPGLSIFRFQGGGAPFVIASNNLNALVGSTIATGSGGALVLTPTFRVVDDHNAPLATPMTLPDGHTVFSTRTQVRFAGPNGIAVHPVDLDNVYGTPTRTASGLIVVVGMRGRVMALSADGRLIFNTSLPSFSFAGAAASRSNVFVSTGDALVTLDAQANQTLRTFAWTNGGLSTPAIGPSGRVYAIAANTLFVFPPLLQVRPGLPQNPPTLRPQ